MYNVDVLVHDVQWNKDSTNALMNLQELLNYRH